MAANDFKEGSDVLNIEYSGFFEESLFWEQWKRKSYNMIFAVG